MATQAVFTHEIRVGWGDCDPAKIVYTGKLPAMALDAINAWWEEHLGHGWYQMELDDNLGTPFVQLQMNFEHPVTPRARLICHVWPVKLGNTSITFRVDGFQDGYPFSRKYAGVRYVLESMIELIFTERGPNLL